MARPIWDGHITFGLINIPVALHSAERRNNLKLHMMDKRNQGRIKYQRINEETGEEVPWKFITKAYEFGEGKHVLLDKDDFKSAAVEKASVINLLGFVQAEAIEPVYFEKPYYLVATKHGQKGYALLRETLERTDKAGLARVVIKTKEYLATLIPWGDILCLILMRFDEEIIDPSKLLSETKSESKAKVSPEEIAMAESLVKSMTMEWQPEQFRDEYQKKLLDWINKKIKSKGKPVTPVKSKAKDVAPSNVIDMVALLKKSMGKKSGKSTSKTEKKSRKKTAKKSASRRVSTAAKKRKQA